MKEIQIKENTKIRHIAKSGDSLSFIVNKNANLEVICLDNKDVNTNITIILKQEHAQASIKHGFNIKENSEVSINHNIIHDAPNTISSISSQGVVNNNAVLHYMPKVTVTKQGSEAKARQLVHILKTGQSKVLVDTVPQLDITSDQVTCSHGASVSPISNDVLHQLTSRGINSDIAEDIIIENHVNKYIKQLAISN